VLAVLKGPATKVFSVKKLKVSTGTTTNRIESTSLNKKNVHRHAKPLKNSRRLPWGSVVINGAGQITAKSL